MDVGEQGIIVVVVVGFDWSSSHEEIKPDEAVGGRVSFAADSFFSSPLRAVIVEGLVDSTVFRGDGRLWAAGGGERREFSGVVVPAGLVSASSCEASGGRI